MHPGRQNQHASLRSQIEQRQNNLQFVVPLYQVFLGLAGRLPRWPNLQQNHFTLLVLCVHLIYQTVYISTPTHFSKETSWRVRAWIPSIFENFIQDTEWKKKKGSFAGVIRLVETQQTLSWCFDVISPSCTELWQELPLKSFLTFIRINFRYKQTQSSLTARETQRKVQAAHIRIHLKCNTAS
jgi:hypothetical protein